MHPLKPPKTPSAIEENRRTDEKSTLYISAVSGHLSPLRLAGNPYSEGLSGPMFFSMALNPAPSPRDERQPLQVSLETSGGASRARVESSLSAAIRRQIPVDF